MGNEQSVISILQRGYYWEAKIYLTAIKLDIFSHLHLPQTAEGVASAIGADPLCLKRLLEALVAMEFVQCNEGRFQNSPIVTEFLSKQSPFYMGDIMLLQDAEWNHWGSLEAIIRSGKPNVTGNIFMNNPEQGERVHRVLAKMAKRMAPDLLRRIDLSSCHTMLDLGGGAGIFSAAFLHAYPHLHGTLFDLPQVLPITRKQMEQEGLVHRMELISGDFNQDEIPGTYDVVFLSDILHYQTPEENGTLFQKLYRSVNPNGRIIVKDMFLGGEDRPGWNAIFSIHLMVYTEKGRCFKKQDVEGWLAQASFTGIEEIERNAVLTARR
jgi:predicted O-methyltransferase YrrM